MRAVWKRTEYIPWRPGEKIRIAFLFQVAFFWPSWESFYQACLADVRFDVRLVHIDSEALENVQTRTAAGFLRTNSLNAVPFGDFDFDGFQAHVVVMQTPYEIMHRLPESYSARFAAMGSRIAYIPYGIEISDTPEARHVHFDNFTVRNCWRIYTLSPWMLEEYRKHCPNRGAVRAFGLPKFDAYLNPKRFPLPPEVRERAAGRKIALLKMHFEKTQVMDGRQVQLTPRLSEYARFAERMDEFPDLFFIVQPHPSFIGFWMSEDQKREAAELLERFAGKASVWLDRSDDYRVALINADAVMIDRSALMVEAAATGAPILFLSNPDYAEPMTEPIARLVGTYEQGLSAEDMTAFLRRFRKGEDSGKAARQEALREVVPFLDGKCGLRIRDDIADSIAQEAGEGKIPRIILYGAGQIFDFYRERTDVFQGCEIAAVSDSDPARWGTMAGGHEIIEPAKLREMEADWIVIASERYYSEIFYKLVYEIKLEPDRILRFDRFAIWSQERRTLS